MYGKVLGGREDRKIFLATRRCHGQLRRLFSIVLAFFDHTGL